VSSIYTRQAAAFRNELKQTCAALVGLVQGVLADGVLHDREVEFLHRWLVQAESVSLIWPGSVIRAQIEHALADEVITDGEREHLVQTLQRLIGGDLDDEAAPVATLAFDQIASIDFEGRSFCFTGDFVFGQRSVCERASRVRGAEIVGSVSKKLHYLVVGGLGSQEWKHGSFGTKIEKAISVRGAGAPLLIVAEDVWACSLGPTPA
jgi:NAD-dependent DNA ligase